MTKSITAFEAPALVDAHSNVTRLELYERLQGKTLPKGTAGLTSYVSQGAMEFAAQDAGWRKLSKHDRSADIGGVKGFASAWTTADTDGEFVAVFQHVPQYMHAISWAKAGVPPRGAVLSATWTAMVFGIERVAIVVMTDRRIVTYWVEPGKDDVDLLTAASADMARRLAENDPPPLDSAEEPTPAPANAAEAAPQDLDALVLRWKATSTVAADAGNASKLATAAADAAAVALKAMLPKGSAHEVDGIKVSHNAKNGRLLEEKTDAAYF
jgi:hypothetical protein